MNWQTLKCLRTFGTEIWVDEHSCTLLETLLGKPLFCSEHRVTFLIVCVSCFIVFLWTCWCCFPAMAFHVSVLFLKNICGATFLKNISAIHIELDPQLSLAFCWNFVIERWVCCVFSSAASVCLPDSAQTPSAVTPGRVGLH